MATRMQQRRGTATQWTTADPILAAGEIGFETDTSQFKIGDGTNHWSDLSYFKNLEDLGGTLDDYIPLTQKEAANGVATLDSSGYIPVSQLGNIIGDAPSILDTLEEIAYALDDPLGLVDGKITTAITAEAGNRDTAITTAIGAEATARDQAISSAIGTHSSDTTSVHGIADTSALATKTYADSAVSTHSSDTTNVHGITDTANLVYTSALTSGLSGKQDVVSGVSSTEIGYLDGVTSAIQTQIDGKAATSHTHAISAITDLQTSLDAKLNLSGGTLTGALTLSGAPTSDLHAATKLYVDGLAAGINFHQPVVAATTGDLAGTYNNGTNGFGATLTKASNGAIGTIDGASVSVGNRILVRAQTDSTQNGIYTITAVGSGSAPWQITRATDADNNPSGELATGDFCFVTGGSTNAAKGFILSTTGTITIGTTNIAYSQFNASEAVTAGTNISKSGSTISVIDAPTFAGLVTATAAGVAFSDGTQTKQGVPSLTDINQQAGAYTTVLADRDKLVEVSSGSGVTVTIPTNASVAYPVGTSIDILQTGSGQVTIAGDSGVTVNATPGLKLRTQWSSATLFKRATNTWVVFGDLSA
jgi:hypothetical protein